MRSRGLAQAFPTQKKWVPCPSRVLCERAGLLEARDRKTGGLCISARGGVRPSQRKLVTGSNPVSMPWGLTRYQLTGDIHFITFSCYRRALLLGSGPARDRFVVTLERVRRWYGFYFIGFVVMPEHVHLLLSEPERGNLAVVLQMPKQIVSRKPQ
jgi:hypothetical protein